MSEEANKPDLTPGIIAWNEIVTSDKDACIKFYSGLFDWTTEDMDLPDGNTYTMFKKGERMIAGCVVPPGDPKPPSMWMTYVNVEDVDASLAKTKELGGTVLMDRVDLPMGSFAVVSDPQGAAFAFWRGSDKDCDA